jgi:hypothetical protein
VRSTAPTPMGFLAAWELCRGVEGPSSKSRHYCRHGTTHDQFRPKSRTNPEVSSRTSLAWSPVKRLLIVVALLVTLAPAMSASATTSLSSQLLSGKNLTKQWSAYYVESQETATCPESNFGRPTSKSSARTFFADHSTGTLILEDLRVTKSPIATYDALVEATLKCSKAKSALSKYVTYQQVRSIQIAGISNTHRAFSLAAEAGGHSVSGRVVYALRGKVVVAFAELSIERFNAGQFESTLAKALAKVPN